METVDNKNEKWLPMRGAITLSREQGREVTRAGLIYAGKEMDFIRKHPDGFHWEFEQNGILKWLEGTASPSGWFTIQEFADEMGLELSIAYNIYRKYRLECKKYGKVRGLVHVRIKDAIKAYKDYKRKYGNVLEGQVTVREFAEEVGISISIAYSLIQKYQLEQERCGSRGLVHVQRRDAIEAYKKYKGGYYGRKEEIQSLL